MLAPFLATLRPDDPLITVEEAQFAEAVDGLHTHLDLAVLTAPPPRHLSTRPVAELPIITLETSARPRQLLDEALAQEGLSPRGIVECSNPQVAQALAAAGRGVAVVSDDPRFDLRPLLVRTDRSALTLTLFAAWDAQHHAARELNALAERLNAFCLQRYGAATDAQSQTSPQPQG